MNDVTINRNELAAILLKVKGARPATITTCTSAGLKSPMRDVLKTSVTNVMVNWNYQNAVNRLLEKQGQTADFEAQPRKWGDRVKGTPLVQYKGDFYLECKVEKSLSHTYHRPDGTALSDTEINPYRPAKKDHQGPKDAVMLRDYKLTSIVGINIDGKRYIVR